MFYTEYLFSLHTMFYYHFRIGMVVLVLSVFVGGWGGGWGGASKWGGRDTNAEDHYSKRYDVG